jgi:hypothetical protein
MNKRTSKRLREAAGVGNRQVYQALKREWNELPGKERARRRLAAAAKAAAPAAAPEKK